MKYVRIPVCALAFSDFGEQSKWEKLVAGEDENTLNSWIGCIEALYEKFGFTLQISDMPDDIRCEILELQKSGIPEKIPSSLDPRPIAKEIINILAKYQVPIKALDIVYAAVDDGIVLQKIQKQLFMVD